MNDRDSHEEADELRERYQELLSEIRVILPGLQVLFAFLITAPFSGRFGELDTLERTLYTVSLVASTAGLVFLITPVAYHRLSDRHDRHDRIAVAIRLKLASLAALGVSIAAGLCAVVSFVFAVPAGLLAGGAFVIAAVSLWLVLPLRRRPEHAKASDQLRVSDR